MAEKTPDDVTDLVRRLWQAAAQTPVNEENRQQAAQTDFLLSTIVLREKYAGRAFRFLICWMSAVGVIVLLQGFGPYTRFSLSDLVLSTIVGGTAVAVVGLAHAVIRGLFGKPS